ncbi:MAG TPA: hypothetical protein VII75_04305 [Thermoanaerobaculia bacterium]|nr:hypothetical protein [Thermoanaerobaculia bacterium]
MKLAPLTFAMFMAATIALSEPHPGNARGAAACSALFFDDGNFDEAKFFSKLANEEALVPEALIARARLDMHEGRGSFAFIFPRELTSDPAFGAILLRGAAELVEHGNLCDASTAVSLAIRADPSLQRVATEWLEFAKRSHPAASVAPPLPKPARPVDADEREAQCRALAPPLFPDPFDGHAEGRKPEEHIWQSGETSVMDVKPCVAISGYVIVVGNDGRVESVTSNETGLIPIVMKQLYKPATIRGVPVRSVTHAGIARGCR